MLALSAFAYAAPEQAQPNPIAFQRFQLPNGVRVVMVHAPDAPRQTTFTFLPITMASDDAHRAQWSHLLEHMVIRSTDPIGLQAPGIMLNGETTHMYLRLETFTEPAHWKDALQRHATWLGGARKFDADVLAREKGNIAIEEQNTAANGYTAKFALAAWNQALSHGLNKIAVHGDVANATLEDVQAYAAAKLLIDDSATIATIGPIAADQVRTEIERLIGGLEQKPAKPQAATRPDQKEFGGAHRATWDLPTRHAMWFWKLPDHAPATLAAVSITAQAINSFFFTDADLKTAVRHAIVYPTVNTPDGNLLIIDCCLPADADAAALWAKLKPALAQLVEGGARYAALAWTSRALAQQFDLHPDFNALRAQLPPMMKDNAEGAWLLEIMNREYFWRVEADQIAKALGQIDKAALKAVLDTIINTEPGTLTLEPE